MIRSSISPMISFASLSIRSVRASTNHEPPSGSTDPLVLYKWLEAYEEKTGGRVMSIAHNGNWGTGMMFALEKFKGGAIDTAYAETRARWEPVYEVTQIKGDGEAHPFLSPNDEFADFGTWDKGDVGGRNVITEDMLPGQYARAALRRGLQQEAKLGANPFKFGLIGSTDAHTSLATTREDNNFGKNPPAEPEADRWSHEFFKGIEPGTSYYTWETLASGYAAVWAHENTREALFDAMQKKEVYATTGTRIRVRVFAGWEFTESHRRHVQQPFRRPMVRIHLQDPLEILHCGPAAGLPQAAMREHHDGHGFIRRRHGCMEIEHLVLVLSVRNRFDIDCASWCSRPPAADEKQKRKLFFRPEHHLKLPLVSARLQSRRVPDPHKLDNNGPEV